MDREMTIRAIEYGCFQLWMNFLDLRKHGFPDAAAQLLPGLCFCAVGSGVAALVFLQPLQPSSFSRLGHSTRPDLPYLWAIGSERRKFQKAAKHQMK